MPHPAARGRNAPGRSGIAMPSIPTPETRFLLLAATLLSAAAVPAIAAGAPPARTALVPLPAQSGIARAVMKVVDREHYPPLATYSDLSHRILARYIDTLDPGHIYFTRGQINGLEKKFGGTLLADARRGDLGPAFAIYARYRDQVRERIGRALGVLDGKPRPLPSGTYAPGPSTMPPADTAALDQHWRKRIANELLALRLGGESRKTATSVLEARYRHRLDRVQATRSATIFDRFMDACLRALDPHSDYFSPLRARQFEDRTDLRGDGIGVRLAERQGYATVTGTVPGSPAAGAHGLRPGDRIVGIGGRDVMAWRLADIADALHGPPGSPLSLLVLRAGEPADGKAASISLTRAAIGMDAGRASAYIVPGRVKTLQYKIGVIRVPSIYAELGPGAARRARSPDVSGDVRYLLRLLKTEGVSAVILDLRNDRGGSVRQALALAGLFIPRGPVIQVENAAGHIRTLSTPVGSVPVWRGPLGVLTNHFTASAAEILTSTLHDYGRAIVMGARTWGKGTIQTLIPLQGREAGAVKLTVAQYFGLNGSSPQRRGIRPDIDIPDASNNAGPQGEAEYSNALPWKTVSPVKHPTPDGDLRPAIKKLKRFYDDKLRNTDGFRLYEHELAVERQGADRKAVSFDFDRRKAALARRRSIRLALDNAWRKLEGEPAFGSLGQAARARFKAPDIALRTSAELMAHYVGFSPSPDIELNGLHLPLGKYHCKENPLDIDGSYTRCVNYGRRIIRPPAPASMHESLKAPSGGDRMPRAKTLQ